FVSGSSNITTYGYNANSGKLETRTDVQANLKWTNTYESATGRLDTETITTNTSPFPTQASFDLGYDLAGNIISKASTVFDNASNGTWAYQYDGASRLTQAILDYPGTTPPSTQWDYKYDGAGSRALAKQTTLPST